MIQKSSILIPSDKNGVLTVNVFHLYKGFSRKVSYFGDFVKISIRKTKPENTLTKKTKKKSIIVRTKKSIILGDGSSVRYNYNSAIILKKRLTPEGKEIYGPITRNFKKKKFLSSFSGLI
jgi:large subunit ribosomal protein L14